MTLRGASPLAAVLACVQALPAVAQNHAAIIFGGDVFDVTGAGVLDLGILDEALMPYRRAFDQGRERLGVELTINAADTVQDCRVDANAKLAPAGKALCAQALRVGLFRPYPGMVLDYTSATYRLSIRSHTGQPIKGEATFKVSTAYPFDGQPVTFGSYVIPPENERLTLADLQYRSMEYPRDALQNDIEAQVIVAVTFDEQGRVTTCRPVRSSNTARIAYDTCLAARRGFSLRKAPDARPYVWVTHWRLAED
ncbi:energy transducer TonB [uncultured Erythrobacter sp.]|uniref:energy transducer TonB n=1 Tax=uncultured Erythrobacter sp. TaxID=263913 RepID=UPI002657D832|nr:energy transducer TonB [uncultured Erythrobacter sp.]